MKPVLIDSKTLALVHVASDDPTRDVINGIHVTQDYAEATDGRKLIRLNNAKLPCADDFPEVAGVPDGLADSGVVIRTELAKDLAKDIPKKVQLPVQGTARIASEVIGEGIDATRRVVATTIKNLSSPLTRKADDPTDEHRTYPNCDVVLEGLPSEPKAVIALSPKHLKDICEFAIKAEIDSLKFAVADELSPVKITGTTKSDERECIIALMPMRLS